MRRRRVTSACPCKWRFIVRSSGNKVARPPRELDTVVQDRYIFLALVISKNSGGHSLINRSVFASQLTFCMCIFPRILCEFILLKDPGVQPLIIQENEKVSHAVISSHLISYGPAFAVDFVWYPVSYGPVMESCGDLHVESISEGQFGCGRHSEPYRKCIIMM